MELLGPVVTLSLLRKRQPGFQVVCGPPVEMAGQGVLPHQACSVDKPLGRPWAPGALRKHPQCRQPSAGHTAGREGRLAPAMRVATLTGLGVDGSAFQGPSMTLSPHPILSDQGQSPLSLEALDAGGGQGSLGCMAGMQ